MTVRTFPPTAAAQRGALALELPDVTIAGEPARVGPWRLSTLLGEGEFCRVYCAHPAREAQRAAPSADDDRPRRRDALDRFASEPRHATPPRPKFLSRAAAARGGALEDAYALKLLRKKWHNVPAAVATIAREAEVGRAVVHCHLMPVLDARWNSTPYYVVLPHLRGATLAERLARRSLSLAMALGVVRQTAEALAALHAAGWMHADVKPSNIHLSPEGHVTLFDLGFARRSRDDESAVMRPVAGTLAYMAPEMITSTLTPDIRSDIYSLGAVLYECLAGRPPFRGDASATVEQIVGRRPQPLTALNPNLPAAVAMLVEQMLAKQPLRRPQSPRELVQSLLPLEIEHFADRGR